jgi:succinyl-CoA synthetase alpha subunit
MDFLSPVTSQHFFNLSSFIFPLSASYPQQKIKQVMNWIQPNQVLVQGRLESPITRYISEMKAYGTKIVGGISPGRGGQTIEEIPVFDLVEDAIKQLGKVEVSLISVPPYEVLDAALEAIAAGIEQIIILTPCVPPFDVISLLQKVRNSKILVLGPGSNGIIIPNQICLGKFNLQFYTPGKIGLISRTQHLCDEVALALRSKGIGQSFVVNLGNEKISGSTFQQWLGILHEDSQTEAIVLIGTPGNGQEEAAAYYQELEKKKPVIAYIAGLQAPRERIFRDATTIIANQLSYSVPTTNTDKQTLAALSKAGVKIAKRPAEIPELLEKVLSNS